MYDKFNHYDIAIHHDAFKIPQRVRSLHFFINEPEGFRLS